MSNEAEFSDEEKKKQDYLKKFGDKDNRWQKGVSGNPKGKPKGILNSKTVFKRWLETREYIKNPITGEVEELTQYDIVALATLKKARGGSVPHINALLDRAEGKPVQNVIQEVSQKLVARIEKEDKTNETEEEE